jgi:hypothetical protein
VNSFLNESETKLNNNKIKLDYILNNINKINNDIINLLNVYEKDKKNIDINDLDNMNILFDRINIDISKYNVDLHKCENNNENIINNLDVFNKNNQSFKLRPKLKKNEQIISTKYNINKDIIEEIKSKIQLIKKYMLDLNLNYKKDYDIIKNNPIQYTSIDKNLNSFKENLKKQEENYNSIRNEIYDVNNKINMSNKMIRDMAVNISNQMDYLYDKIKNNNDKINELKNFKKDVYNMYYKKKMHHINKKNN